MGGESEPWSQAAEEALAMAAHGDEEQLVEAMSTILKVHGLRYAEDMMLYWADNCPHPHVDQLTAADGEFQLYDTNTGTTSAVEDVAPDTQWAGGLLIARWKGDEDRVRELFASVPDSHDMMIYATIVLQMCGHLVRILAPGLRGGTSDPLDGAPAWVKLASDALSAEIGRKQVQANELTLSLMLAMDPDHHIEVVYLWAAVTNKIGRAHV